MKANDIREMSAAEIEQRIDEETRDITDLKFRRTVTGLENPIVLRDKRRAIARMKTVLREKQTPDTPRATATDA
ncbi:50S ribosomal protein L29 [Rubrivirga sp. S365]|uniref:Large ribosomal subunit protein uL29 n=1 Tax=Rubrivirga litoralis TaxID=3075598 RepID=A0ABU3BRZ6_9BACT|nr:MULTISPECIES: 50S ribosomal protein L29 [unclassified Rubrivirga]MDT0632057.1 50S ribosomal protein L29 [Rubrivirga sp. F394]MDT7856135.1 50S ribosomal protein L29 [Rubrivirga sp. S365]